MNLATAPGNMLYRVAGAFSAIPYNRARRPATAIWELLRHLDSAALHCCKAADFGKLGWTGLSDTRMYERKPRQAADCPHITAAIEFAVLPEEPSRHRGVVSGGPCSRRRDEPQAHMLHMHNRCLRPVDAGASSPGGPAYFR